MVPSFKPTKEQILAAEGKSLPDVIAPGLRVLFCGINPGLYTAAVGHHFARPGNRFWPALHIAGFTPRRLSPFEENELLGYGLGITNMVERATAGADSLSAAELAQGAARLKEKLREYRPCFIAVLGMGAYRTGFGKPKASIGLQSEMMEGVRIWVLPNPSGINANYRMDALAGMLAELKKAADRLC